MIAHCYCCSEQITRDHISPPVGLLEEARAWLYRLLVQETQKGSNWRLVLVLLRPVTAPALSLPYPSLCWTKNIYVHQQLNHVDPDDGCNMYLRNVENSDHICTMQTPKSRNNINSTILVTMVMCK